MKIRLPHGVFQKGRRFAAKIILGGKKHYLGSFSTPALAAEAHDSVAEYYKLPCRRSSTTITPRSLEEARAGLRKYDGSSLRAEEAAKESAAQRREIRRIRNLAHKGTRIGKLLVLDVTEVENQFTFHCNCDCGANVVIQHETNLLRRKYCGSSCEAGKPASVEISRPWQKVLSGIKDRRGRRRERIKLLITRDQAFQLLRQQKFKCALSGQFITTRGANCSASLDRIDSNGHYEIGNVQWLHKSVNIMKNALPQAHFIHLCKLIAEKAEPKQKSFPRISA